MMDVDDEDLFTEWNTVGLPTPTIQTLNKDNNKAHLVWLLNVPVSKRNKKAVRYYKDIVNSIKLLIGADRAYQNHQTKNFLNQELFRVTYNDVAYDLNDFQNFIIKDENDLTIKQEGLDELESTGSRHIDLFNQLRKYGYTIAKHKNLFEKLQKRAELINSQYQDPIKPKAIIKSVHSFCDENKNNFKAATKIKPGAMKFKKIQNLSKEKYKEEVTTRQSKSAKRTTTIRRHKTSIRIKVAIDALIRRKTKLTYINLSKEAQCSLRTVKRYAKIVKLFVQKVNGVIGSIRVIALEAEGRSTEPLKCYIGFCVDKTRYLNGLNIPFSDP